MSDEQLTRILERMMSLERRLAEMERREFTAGGGALYAPLAKGVTNGDSHDHAGGDGAQIDHGGLAGLGDDDHPRYFDSTRHTKAAHDALAIDADTLDGSHAAAFALAAKGVTNGDSHDHAGGDGAQVDHGGLAGLGDDDHTQYLNNTRGDARYALLAKGVTNGDSHDHAGGDGAQVDHGGLAGLGDDDHPRYFDSTRHTKAAHDSLGLTGVYAVLNPRSGIITDGSALAVGTYDYTLTSYSVPSGATAVVVIIMAKWSAASTSSNIQALVYNTTEVYGQIGAAVASHFGFITAIVPIASDKLRIKVNGADTTGTYILLAGYFK